MKIGDPITVMWWGRMFRSEVKVIADRKLYWSGYNSSNSVFQEDEGSTWLEGHGPEQEAALRAADALIHDTQPITVGNYPTVILSPMTAGAIAVGDAVTIESDGLAHSARPGQVVIGHALEVDKPHTGIAPLVTCRIAIR